MRAAEVCRQDGRVLLRCVIVDDDPAFLHVAQATLERGGVIVSGVAGSGAESGFEVARKLADNGYAPALVMISVDAWEDFADLIDESPAAGFLAKTDLSGAAIRRILAIA
jgi:hypothetical protein